MTNDYARSPAPHGSFLTSRAGIVLFAFLGLVGFLLTTEHSAHALGALLWLVILVCPLLHVFMHGRQEHGDKDRRESKGTKEMAHEH
jgi:hypothetical protein